MYQGCAVVLSGVSDLGARCFLDFSLPNVWSMVVMICHIYSSWSTVRFFGGSRHPCEDWQRF